MKKCGRRKSCGVLCDKVAWQFVNGVARRRELAATVLHIASRLKVVVSCVLLAGVGCGVSVAQVQQSWVARYNGPDNGSDSGCCISVDHAGNVYVFGHSGDGSASGTTNGVSALIKYDQDGNQIWVARDSGAYPNYAFPWLPLGKRSLATDGAGNSYVTGTYWPATNNSPDFVTSKYDPNGRKLWSSFFNGPADASAGLPPGYSYDAPSGLAVDGAGNVYVTGFSAGFAVTGDYVTIKYDSNGALRWVRRYNGTGNSQDRQDRAIAIVVDAVGNVYVTGWSVSASNRQDYLTIKYDPEGNQLWTARFDGPFHSVDEPAALAVDAMGNVYVTGGSVGSANCAGDGDWSCRDITTIKYDALGNQLWVARRERLGRLAEATDIAVDIAGNVYVSGSYDVGIIKYDANGNELWTSDFGADSTYFSASSAAMALDNAGNAYVTGTSRFPAPPSYWTSKHDSGGNRLWSVGYRGPGSWGHFANALAVDETGSVHVTGSSATNDAQFSDDFATIKYIPTNIAGLPIITRPPQSVTVSTGASATLSVTATGPPPLHYRWIVDGVYWNGSDNPTLSLSNLLVTHIADWSVEVGNAVGAVVSPKARVMVNGPPVIWFQPDNQTVFDGLGTTFYVEAAGTPPLAFQWFRDGLPVGLNRDVLELPNVQATNAGTYTVVVTNAYGAVTSAPATLVVQSRNLLVTVPASAPDTAGTLTNAGVVRLSGTLFTNLTVSLFSSDLTVAVVPTSVTIPAGQPSATFSITVVADLLADDSRMVTVTASAPGFTGGAASMTLLHVPAANPQAIRIFDDDVADPYPSAITVTGATEAVSNILVTLYGLSHTYASDFGVLLVGPEGQSVVLMNGAGGASKPNNVTLTIVDDAPFLPREGPILTGSYRPTNFYTNDVFWSPAPSPPYGSALRVFNGTNPNGEWRLFVQDFVEDDSGVIAGGWSLTINGVGSTVLPPCGTFGTWASRASRTTNALNDVTFGNGRFVAVGANFNVATSTNGVDWTNQFIGGGFPLNGVTFGNGLFVAVGGNGFVRTSTNGMLWSGPFGPIAGGHLSSVAWGNGAFVAVGTNGTLGTIVTSPNGTSWMPRVSLINALAGVTYGNGRFVAVGTSGTVLVSTNGGTNWGGITRGVGTSANLADVTFGNGQFVAVGPAGTLFTSLDGLVWTARDPGTRADLTSITYGGGRFVAVGNSGATENGIFMTSTDGILWSTNRLPWPAWWNDVVFGRNNFVAVGQGGAILQSGQRAYIAGQPQGRTVCATDPVSFTFSAVSACPLAFQWQLNGTNLPGATSSNLSIASARVEDAGSYTAVASDGVDTLVSTPATLQVNLCRALDQWTQRAPPPGSNALNGVVCAPNSFVAVGNAGTILRSADKMSWFASAAGTNVTLSAVAHGGGAFVAVGFNGVILNSSNAGDWALRDSGTSRILRNIAHGGGRFVAVGDFGTVLSSPDGLTWTAQDLGTNRTLLGLTWANDQFMAVGPGGYLATSPDGAIWTRHASGLTLTLYDVAYGDGTFVAVGNAGAITISTNGFDWTRQPPLATNLLHGVTWANGAFVAVGVGGLVLTSPDGISWTMRNSRTIQDLNDITYGGNAFVAVGANGTILVSGFSAPPKLSGRVASDHFELNLTAEIGLNYRVQASPSLPATNWLDLFSFTNSWPVTTLRDMSATNEQQRFYRVVSP